MSIAEPVGSTEIDSGAFRQSDNTDVEKAAESLDTSLRRVSEASTREIENLVDEFHGLRCEGRPEMLPAGLLTRHTAIFAGSGSGKTVLLRRIVEEAALLGIPAIVLDTNNDLARLGQLWPARPTAFNDDDTQRAQRYKQMVEVVVWTPGLAGGRALNLAVLPDFSVITDEEEREQAVDMA